MEQQKFRLEQASQVDRRHVDASKRSKPKLMIELHSGEEATETFLKKFSYQIIKPLRHSIVVL